MAALAAGGDRPRADRVPNSTTATKLLPLVPYHVFVPGLARRRRRRASPSRAEVKATGMLGAASSNGWIDRGVDALEAVDLAPRHPPAAEVALEPVERAHQARELLVRAERSMWRIFVGGWSVRRARSTPCQARCPRNASVLAPMRRDQRLSQLRSSAIGSASRARSAGRSPAAPATPDQHRHQCSNEGSALSIRRRAAGDRGVQVLGSRQQARRVDRPRSSRRPCRDSAGKSAGFG